MFILRDKSVEKAIRAVDPSAKVDNVLYLIILNGVEDDERILWTKRKKILGWMALASFILYVLFLEIRLFNILFLLSVAFWSGTSGFLNDTGFVVLDERGYTLYVLNKWQTKVTAVYPLSFEEIESCEPADRILRKRTAHLHLYVKEKYFHVIVSRRTLGLKKQKRSFHEMMSDFTEKTYRKDLDFYNFDTEE
ncbi:MAG TPA: hypothetical protein DEF30_10935 [Proteiniclasticum sp.]|uniref:hypothetical protein n=1 Tax=Proteiniclasticum sp. TaxID=2053595 RepID=UPI000E997085|nr:hypothetical protein [Proteiniclasticum sp.]HBW14320.1 hypothetical protein [Proteiniclasticum sp.]